MPSNRERHQGVTSLEQDQVVVSNNVQTQIKAAAPSNEKLNIASRITQENPNTKKMGPMSRHKSRRRRSRSASAVTDSAYLACNHFEDDPEFNEKIKQVEFAIDHNVLPQRIYEGSSGSYFAKNVTMVSRKTQGLRFQDSE